MRPLLALLLLPLPALAQVSTNDSALDALGPAKPAAAQKAPAAPVKRAIRHPVHAVRPAQRLPAVPIPAAPPANPVIPPPPFIMPAHKPLPPPPVPVKADAAGTATAIGGATRITFGPATADLNPATVAALQKIAAEAHADPNMQIDVTAWAPGTPEDPSTPRRLSLDRALAARAVLINAGIVSDRIHAIAKGFNDIGTAPPDRVDVAEILPPPPKSPKPAPPGPATAKP
jgi:outer membrane protein OmpA-like peptidoglycan-associated protein